MAFPKLLQKLFQDSGAGSMLRTDIIPTDSSLSSTSTNAIQNKTVASAIASANAHADSTGYQVGDIKLYAGSNVPNGWFRCDGSTIADMATNYPKLYAVLGTNVLPNYSGRYPLGSVTGINQSVEAGLPDASGEIGTSGTRMFTIASGVFAGKANGNYGIRGDSGKISYSSAEMQLSRSNSIFGNSDTVTPPSVKCAYLIKHD